MGSEEFQKCRWCLKHAKLIRAHIIPKAFYRPIKGESDRFVILNPAGKKHAQFSSSGIFDSSILCSACDGFLGKLDEYGLRIFGGPPPETDRISQGFLPGYDLRCEDVQRAQKFLLSVLWRASVTSQDFFRTISLGPRYEDKICHLIANDLEITEADFEFVAIRVYDHPYDGGIVPPFRARFEAVNAVQLYLPYYKFIVRMDRRPFSPMAALGRFLPGVMPQCLRLSFNESVEAKIVRSVTEKSLERRFAMSS